LRIGIYDSAAPERRSRSASELERLAAAEELGLDAIWLADHGLPGGGEACSLHFELGQLAALTTGVELGMHAFVPELLHPLRVAEDLAVLDIMSAGRIAWAVRASPVEGSGLWREQLAVIREAWRGEPFAFEGEHLRFPEVSAHPRPMRDPHPPLWLDGECGDGALSETGCFGRFVDSEVSEERIPDSEDEAPLLLARRLSSARDIERTIAVAERARPEGLLLQLDPAEARLELLEEAIHRLRARFPA
jgi:hypothetical protein